MVLLLRARISGVASNGSIYYNTVITLIFSPDISKQIYLFLDLNCIGAPIVIYFTVLIGNWIMGLRKTMTNLTKDN
jgi:hypothetical protein